YSGQGSPMEQRLVRLHEAVHQFFSPKLKFLRRFRASLWISGYTKSALMQYLEEGLAETFAQLRVRGLDGLLEGITFPIQNEYVTIGQLGSEALHIGTIMLGGRIWGVYFRPTPGADHHDASHPAPKLQPIHVTVPAHRTAMR